MTLAHVSGHVSYGVRVISHAARVIALAIARGADRLRDLPSGWHYAIRGISIALVLWVAGAAAIDRVSAAGSRGRSAAEPVVTGPAPVVAKIEVKKPLAAVAEPQLIPITGANFAPGMTARLVSPMDTDTTTFPPLALERLTPTSFELRAPLETPGTYELSVRTPDGQRSNTITLVVKNTLVARK